MLVALLLMTPPLDGLGRRIAEAAQAAQDLQGPLDGAWILADASGHALYSFELVDPPGGHSILQGVWRETGGGRSGAIETIARRPGVLTLTFEDQGTVRVRLHRHDEVWVGDARRADLRLAVILRRN